MRRKSLSHQLFSLAVVFGLSFNTAFAVDAVQSTVLAYDRVANLLVIRDKTVWPLDLLETELPENLKAGDAIEIQFQSNEDDGITVIYSITRTDK